MARYASRELVEETSNLIRTITPFKVYNMQNYGAVSEIHRILHSAPIEIIFISFDKYFFWT
jgi:hypothetical protein